MSDGNVYSSVAHLVMLFMGSSFSLFVIGKGFIVDLWLQCCTPMCVLFPIICITSFSSSCCSASCAVDMNLDVCVKKFWCLVFGTGLH